MDLLGDNRKVVYPLKYPDIFARYEQQLQCFWTPYEIDFSQDKKDFKRLEAPEQEYILQVLTFFAASDSAVLSNLLQQFIGEFEAMECKLFFGIQAAIEGVHSHVYSLMLNELAGDRREALISQIREGPLQKKIAWCENWFTHPEKDQETNMAIRVLAWACTEGIMFSASFASVFWLRTKGSICPGILKSNEFIARDEGLHRDFGVHLLTSHFKRLPQALVHDVVRGAVEVEQAWVDSVLPEGLVGMNHKLLRRHVEFTANHLLESLNYEPMYDAKETFPFMMSISLEGKSNFFEQRVSEYSVAKVDAFSTEEDF